MSGAIAMRPSGLPEFCRLKETRVAVRDRMLSILSVANVDDLVELSRDVDELPFWAELWPSALALSEYLDRLDLSNRSIIELGAGVGLVGLAARCGGARVVQSDYMPLALEFCRANAERNGIDDIEFLLADWRRFPTDRRYDVICGSDILYEPLRHGDLASIFAVALKPGGRVILADPLRPHGDTFSLRMRREGWVESVDFVTVRASTPTPPVTVAVYEFTRSAVTSA